MDGTGGVGHGKKEDCGQKQGGRRKQTPAVWLELAGRFVGRKHGGMRKEMWVGMSPWRTGPEALRLQPSLWQGFKQRCARATVA